MGGFFGPVKFKTWEAPCGSLRDVTAVADGEECE